MEKDLKIPIENKKYIYGTLRGSLDKPLIVFVHGLGGYRNEHIYFNGARYFEKNGYSSFRFDLYSYKKDARKLQDCILSIHARDLDTVIRYFRSRGVQTIHVVGHSFGGPTILLSKRKDFNKVVLWDPSIDTKELEKEVKYIQGCDAYYVDWGSAVIIGKKMIEEDRKIKPTELIEKIHVPIKLLFAGKGKLKNKANLYFNKANTPKELSVIPNANHNFDEDGLEEKLFDETLKWFDKKF